MKDKQKREVYIPQKAKIKNDLEIRKFPFTPKQLELISLIQDRNTKVCIVSGPAGCAKSLIAVYCALEMLNSRRVGEIIYVRNAVECTSHPLGFLPGLASEKFAVYEQPIREKLDELLPKHQIQQLFAGEHIRTVPLGFIRGTTHHVAFTIGEEMQSTTKHEILTLMTRIGKHSKLVLLGDERQSDIKNSGFATVFNAFNTKEATTHGIVTFKFGIEDIMREEVIKYIIETFDKMK